MLRQVRPQKGAECPISQAEYPIPFPPGLEFNPPAHGAWNIVHTGMQVPQCHQIYVCGANCMRGVVLTAAEMNAADRFSMVILEERDLLEGTVEDITIEGTADAIRKLPKEPRAVMLFTVCVHHFLGCDLERIYEELEKRFPNITFFRCYMDPIMRKNGLTPDQKLRRSMTEVFSPCPPEPKTIALLGGDFPLSPDNELRQILAEKGWKLRELADCGTFEDYLALGESEVFLTMYPAGLFGVSEAAKRLGREFLYLPQCFGFEEIRSHWERLSARLGISAPDFEEREERCRTALREVRDLVGTTSISIDASFHPRPLGLARLLTEQGFRVERLYLDAISAEEEQDFLWLREHAPALLLRSVIRPEMRVMPREMRDKVLALGQKAAWFEGTPYFVNLVQGRGLWGYDGILELAEEMKKAFLHERDTRDLIPRKGLGCESCV